MRLLGLLLFIIAYAWETSADSGLEDPFLAGLGVGLGYRSPTVYSGICAAIRKARRRLSNPPSSYTRSLCGAGRGSEADQRLDFGLPSLYRPAEHRQSCCRACYILAIVAALR
ncbi:hypothetical protein EJ03DRAFT_137611 [Teratosphaeria nubilosa]|uniref:Uncharacterized protein n=1 Tax=Teratosphaeria nubilosa TaxID=161662 RepID=A0A6G1L4X1_9PEZI|nr:hypothetical protein EJ03DRAFT_137611 [Teratosphaeria nubilosa]